MTPIILVSLDVFASWLKATQPLTTTRITEQISKRTKWQIYKISATVRDSLRWGLCGRGWCTRW